MQKALPLSCCTFRSGPCAADSIAICTPARTEAWQHHDMSFSHAANAHTLDSELHGGLQAELQHAANAIVL